MAGAREIKKYSILFFLVIYVNLTWSSIWPAYGGIEYIIIGPQSLVVLPATNKDKDNIFH